MFPFPHISHSHISFCICMCTYARLSACVSVTVSERISMCMHICVCMCVCVHVVWCIECCVHTVHSTEPILCCCAFQLAKCSNGASYGTNAYHHTSSTFMTFGPLTMTTQGTHSMPVSPCFRHSTTAFPYTPPLPPSKSQPTTITPHFVVHGKWRRTV